RTVDALLVADGSGQIAHHAGNFSDYAERTAAIAQTDSAAGKEKKSSAREETAADSKPKEKALKFSFKEQKEFEQIDDWIAQAELALKQSEAAIAEAGGDFALLGKLTERHQELEAALEQLLERWTYLNELAERIEQQKNK
ncbi:MAG: multidrug transporter ATP-binding protein, partial [Paenibacillus sp.]|nr:multidrug transporter ATP-binding protein [Paenibacillus sp.]